MRVRPEHSLDVRDHCGRDVHRSHGERKRPARRAR